MFKVMSIYIVLETCLEYMRPCLGEEGGSERDRGREKGKERWRGKGTGSWIDCKNSRHL